MKKTLFQALILLVVFAVVGAAAFADGTAATPKMTYSVGTWSGLGISNAATGNTFTSYDYNWVGAGAVRFSMDYTSADGNAGFNSRLQMIGNPASIGNGAMDPNYSVNFNQLNAWGKFFNGMVTVRAGMLDDYTIATPIWNNWGNTDGKVGVYLDFAPVAGLDLGVFQPIPSGTGDVLSNILTPAGTGHTTIGASYKAANVVQVWGGTVLSSTTTASTATSAAADVVYFAGNLLAVKGLTAEFEGAATLYSDGTALTALENVGYAMGPLTVASFIGEGDTATGTFSWGIEPSISYNIDSNLAAQAIVNVYNGAQYWMSPIDAGAVAAGPAGTNFGAGASLSYTASGLMVKVGDYYGVAASENLFYVNVELTL
jgi:hypothetical protein